MNWYDGQGWTTVTVQDGPAPAGVTCLLEDREGALWIGTGGEGVFRYDGHGLADDRVFSMVEDRDGPLWFGTWTGLSRHESERLKSFTVEDGLADNGVRCLLEDRKGDLWFGTLGGGVSCYDGQVFQPLGRRDGLVHDAVQHVIQDRHGDIGDRHRGLGHPVPAWLYAARDSGSGRGGGPALRSGRPARPARVPETDRLRVLMQRAVIVC